MSADEMMPREKALNYGIASLDNSELLALIVKSGYKGQPVMELTQEILDQANGFDNLLSLTYEELTSIKGIKRAKALELLAILEIYKRLSNVEKISEPSLDSPKKVVEWLRFTLGYAETEEFFAVFLDGKGSIIRSEILYKGNKHAANIAVDEIIRKALLHKSSYLLVAHNHPSDNINPSQADIDLTIKLSEACKMMGIPLLDHIIVGKTDYFSFKNHDMIK